MRLLHIFPTAENIEDILDSADQGLVHSYLLSYIKEHADFTVDYKIINQNADEVIKEYKPDVVAITAMTYNFHVAAEVASKAKESGARVIIGGHHISILPAQLTADMDVGVLGEGEITYLELLKLHHEGKWEPQHLKEVDGIVFRTSDNDVHVTPPRPLIQDLDSVGHPIREEAPLSRSTRIALVTSRGCPYKCAFCSQTHFWEGTMRFHSPEYVIEEIERIHRFSGTKEIRIDDGVFLINKRRLLKILELWEKHPLYGRIGFTCWCRANLVNDDMAEIAKRMGVHSVNFGIESNNPESLAYLKGKTVTTDDNQRAYDILTKHGIRMLASFIIGAPFETEAHIRDTFDYIKRNRLLTGDVNVLLPMPGTPIWDHAMERGLVSENMDFSLLGGQQLGKLDIFLAEKLSQAEILTLVGQFNSLMTKRRIYLKFRRLAIDAYTRPWVIPGKVRRSIRTFLD